jgi:hypothetical protein
MSQDNDNQPVAYLVVGPASLDEDDEWYAFVIEEDGSVSEIPLEGYPKGGTGDAPIYFDKETLYKFLEQYSPIGEVHDPIPVPSNNIMGTDTQGLGPLPDIAISANYSDNDSEGQGSA